MCAWFSRVRAPKPSSDEAQRLQLPGGLWTKCLGCDEIVYTRELLRNLMVCPKCEYHFRLSLQQRVDLLCDRHSFVEMDASLQSIDPLGFKDTFRYRDRLKRAQKTTGEIDAIKTGRARINAHAVMLGVFNFSFMGGSMGIVVGERLTRMIEAAEREGLSVMIVSASGGARMQEGIYSLMQMAKISTALVKLGKRGLPYISVLTDPTTGGVAASFAMQGDIIIAEPGALIGFAGPRVIEQTIRKTLPEGFQRSEFLLHHGMLDMVVSRGNLKSTVATLLEMLTPKL